MEDAAAFGRRVRALRTEAAKTLDQVAEASGVSRAMLSKVERGEKMPTIGTATRIACGLGATLSQLLGAAPRADAGVTIVRAAERVVFRDGESGFERHLLLPPDARFEFLLHAIPRGASSGTLPAYPAGTTKHVLVTRGRLSIEIGGDAPITLATGDTMAFAADRPHGFANAGAARCEYVLVLLRP